MRLIGSRAQNASVSADLQRTARKDYRLRSALRCCELYANGWSWEQSVKLAGDRGRPESRFLRACALAPLHTEHVREQSENLRAEGEKDVPRGSTSGYGALPIGGVTATGNSQSLAG